MSEFDFDVVSDANPARLRPPAPTPPERAAPQSAPADEAENTSE